MSQIKDQGVTCHIPYNLGGTNVKYSNNYEHYIKMKRSGFTVSPSYEFSSLKINV